MIDFQSLSITGSGLTAEKFRLDVVASNLANMDSTVTATGGPFQRLMVTLSPRPGGQGVAVSGVLADPKPGPTVYDPGNPAANKQGFVRYPNVNPVTEMVDMISATRSYQANVTALSDEKKVDATLISTLG